ncbi:hypothetical protein PLICRDRAFT_51784 [Plicaturopsis crispa FD-325 SS-3]|nr:hypothetical protein PLICRDRAFT_51784 [Plicaturopsis crispa FD-325 SS-3]
MAPANLSQFDGSVCTLSEWQRSNAPDALIHCFTRGETVGLTISVLSGSVSLLAVTGILLSIMWNLYTASPGKRRLIQEPMDLYMLSLFAANFLQALGQMLGAKWVNDGKSEVGAFCTSQGVVQQLGEPVVALATLVIAIHSFVAVWWSKGVHSLRVAQSIVAIYWLFAVLFVSVGMVVHRGENYVSPSPYWCWLGPAYLKEKIPGEYLWFWLCLAVSFTVYIPLYLWSRGNITIVDESKWLSCRFHAATNASYIDDDVLRRKRRSYAMLAYPFAYCVAVLPLSIVRWIDFVQEAKGRPNGISYQATFGAASVYELSGLFDVLLFLYARPGLLLHSERHPAAASGNRGYAPSLATVDTEKDNGAGEVCIHEVN